MRLEALSTRRVWKASAEICGINDFSLETLESFLVRKSRARMTSQAPASDRQITAKEHTNRTNQLTN